ncbi:hypothetical protein [Burkholderia cepacia]|uniref:hypothetical protein n=1 Tax=Burkholderia cepacia TaxID=292 RepID=UPI001CF142FD|nr:hypothetical protein [Burkholderia cepacia]MCA8026512.1 hypothetical protein [Burkholderia cepacia]
MHSPLQAGFFFSRAPRAPLSAPSSELHLSDKHSDSENFPDEQIILLDYVNHFDTLLVMRFTGAQTAPADRSLTLTADKQVHQHPALGLVRLNEKAREMAA